MALIDFGMKARCDLFDALAELVSVKRELEDVSEQCAKMSEQAQHFEFQLRIAQDRARIKHDAYVNLRKELRAREAALEEIAQSAAKAGSAVRLANIAREALGRPVKGGGDE